jgi:hypothetical protein
MKNQENISPSKAQHNSISESEDNALTEVSKKELRSLLLKRIIVLNDISNKWINEVGNQSKI